MQLVYDSFISNRWKISVEETMPLLNRPFFITYDTVSFQAILSCDTFLSLIFHLLQIKDFSENYVPLSRSKNSPIKNFQNLIPRSDSPISFYCVTLYGLSLYSAKDPPLPWKSKRQNFQNLMWDLDSSTAIALRKHTSNLVSFSETRSLTTKFELKAFTIWHEI